MATITTKTTTTTTTTSDDGFVQEVVFYFVLKIVTSLDDLLWLSPFVAIATTPTEKLYTLLVYASVCLLVSCEALGLAWAAVHELKKLFDAHDDMSRILNVVGAVCIAAIALLEWRNKQAESGDEQEKESNRLDKNSGVGYGSLADTTRTDTTTSTSSSLMEQGEINLLKETDLHNDGDDDGRFKVAESTTRLSWSNSTTTTTTTSHVNVLVDLFVVGVCGTLDTLAVFFSVIMSRIPIRVAPVLVGTVLATAVIMMCAYSITLYRPLTTCLQRVPLWALLLAIALYILVSGLVN